MKRVKMVRYVSGVRYWVTKGRHPMNNRPCLYFWSNHKWPFYHGCYQPDWLKVGYRPTDFERRDAWNHFLRWIPS